MTLAQLYASMGWFAKGIVLTLVLMSIFTLTIAVRKLIDMSRSRAATVKFSGPFSKALADEDFAAAESLVEKSQKSHLAGAFRRVFPSIKFHSQDYLLSAAEIASVQRLIELNTIEQVARFRKGLGVMATVGATAPFVGLLGTTMGVVKTFQGMGEAGLGEGGMGAVTAGIAEALITTAIGLGVAIPAVWLYNYFINRIDYVSMEITYASKEFIDFLLRYEAKLQAGQGGNVLEFERQNSLNPKP
ncbi:MAG: MotA/TolQ/ExbB proton channel family protein [Longimicrobiales bacterium]